MSRSGYAFSLQIITGHSSAGAICLWVIVIYIKKLLSNYQGGDCDYHATHTSMCIRQQCTKVDQNQFDKPYS